MALKTKTIVKSKSSPASKPGWEKRTPLRPTFLTPKRRGGI